MWIMNIIDKINPMETDHFYELSNEPDIHDGDCFCWIVSGAVRIMFVEIR